MCELDVLVRTCSSVFLGGKILFIFFKKYFSVVFGLKADSSNRKRGTDEPGSVASCTFCGSIAVMRLSFFWRSLWYPTTFSRLTEWISSVSWKSQCCSDILTPRRPSLVSNKEGELWTFPNKSGSSRTLLLFWNQCIWFNCFCTFVCLDVYDILIKYLLNKWTNFIETQSK